MQEHGEQPGLGNNYSGEVSRALLIDAQTSAKKKHPPAQLLQTPSATKDLPHQLGKSHAVSGVPFSLRMKWIKLTDFPRGVACSVPGNCGSTAAAADRETRIMYLCRQCWENSWLAQVSHWLCRVGRKGEQATPVSKSAVDSQNSLCKDCKMEHAINIYSRLLLGLVSPLAGQEHSSTEFGPTITWHPEMNYAATVRKTSET